MCRLYEPSAGEVLFAGEDVHRTEGDEGKALNRKMQMIFQDPQASLNPRMVVSDIIAEGIDIHGSGRAAGKNASTGCTSCSRRSA